MLACERLSFTFTAQHAENPQIIAHDRASEFERVWCAALAGMKLQPALMHGEVGRCCMAVVCDLLGIMTTNLV